MVRSALLEVQMEILRRRIAAELRAGHTLTSPHVVALSQRLDQLVLSAYVPRVTKG